MEKPESNIMNRKPRDSKEGIFSGGLGFAVAYQGALVTAITIVSYFVGRYYLADTFHAEAIANGLYSAETLGSSMAFLTLSMAEIFQSFNLRSRRGSIFSMKKQNKWLWMAGAAALLLTTAVIEIPFIASIFNFTPINLLEYAIGLGLSIMTIPLVELVKLIQRTIRKNKDQ
jgi:Ca2+-transporting ATPase